jgi:phage host-nuclease inhibitor protein Gam
MARAGKEIIKRLTAPEIREIVREEVSAAIRPLEVKVEEMDKRLTGEIASLRNELQYAPKVAVLEARVTELEKKLAAR